MAYISHENKSNLVENKTLQGSGQNQCDSGFENEKAAGDLNQIPSIHVVDTVKQTPNRSPQQNSSCASSDLVRSKVVYKNPHYTNQGKNIEQDLNSKDPPRPHKSYAPRFKKQYEGQFNI